MNVSSKYKLFLYPQSHGLFLNSIIPTAFMGTAMIFTCFTLSALYARRRSYLFLGGKYGLENTERVSTLGFLLDLFPYPRPPTSCDYRGEVGSLYLGRNVRNDFNWIALLWLLSGWLFVISYRYTDVSHEPDALVFPREPFLWIHLAFPGETLHITFQGLFASHFFLV